MVAQIRRARCSTPSQLFLKQVKNAGPYLCATSVHDILALAVFVALSALALAVVLSLLRPSHPDPTTILSSS